MRTWYSFFTIILIFSTFSELFAEGGYIGENPGINFYSTIDEGNYSITNKMISVRLKEKAKLEEFARGCTQAHLLKGGETTSEFLEKISNGDYEKLMKLIASNGVAYITTDQFEQLTQCIADRYLEMTENIKKEKRVIENISSIGLYTDGDTSNSDYDILSDIEKINSLIFAIPLKYEGVKNGAKVSFTDLLIGKPIASLFPKSNQGNAGTGTIGTNTGNINTSQSGTSLSALIGGSCSSPSGINVTDMMDGDLTNELNNLLGGGENNPNNGGFALGSTDTPMSDHEKNMNNTSTNDFFHTMPCTSIFCIDVKMNGGMQNLLGGGKNISIEGILEKNSAILDKIKDTSLQYQKMTNNEGGLPYPNLKLKDIIGGARIYLANAPQISRRDKRDDTPERKREEIDSAIRCGLVSVGLPSDPIRANGVGGAGYVLSKGLSSENIDNKTKTLGPQSTDSSRYIGCVEKSMDVGRKLYYDSFSTDLTEIQAFSSSMLSEINEILEIGKALDNKPIK